jgi:hypothetical protein
MELPAHTATWKPRGDGAPVVLVAVQEFVVELYRPPVSKNELDTSNPPQMIISVPVQTAVW